MRTFFTSLLIVLCTIGLLMHSAEAKRFGGGRSFGVSRSVSSLARPAGPSMFNKASASRWLGPLAGLAAGGLLASLFMGNGIGTGIMSWLMIAGLVFVVLNFFRNRQQPMTAKSSYYENSSRDPSFLHSGYDYSRANGGTTPLDFDAEAFLRDAKVQFIRLQAAYDKKNLNDIRMFTTPEVFGEIQLQLQERGDTENVTEVIRVEAQLINASHESNHAVASVRFSGMIREDNQPAAPFSEVWHFEKDMSSSRWMVAGIQQQHA